MTSRGRPPPLPFVGLMCGWAEVSVVEVSGGSGNSNGYGGGGGGGSSGGGGGGGGGGDDTTAAGDSPSDETDPLQLSADVQAPFLPAFVVLQHDELAWYPRDLVLQAASLSQERALHAAQGGDAEDEDGTTNLPDSRSGSTSSGSGSSEKSRSRGNTAENTPSVNFHPLSPGSLLPERQDFAVTPEVARLLERLQASKRSVPLVRGVRCVARNSIKTSKKKTPLTLRRSVSEVLASDFVVSGAGSASSCTLRARTAEDAERWIGAIRGVAALYDAVGASFAASEGSPIPGNFVDLSADERVQWMRVQLKHVAGCVSVILSNAFAGIRGAAGAGRVRRYLPSADVTRLCALGASMIQTLLCLRTLMFNSSNRMAATKLVESLRSVQHMISANISALTDAPMATNARDCVLLIQRLLKQIAPLAGDGGAAQQHGVAAGWAGPAPAAATPLAEVDADSLLGGGGLRAGPPARPSVWSASVPPSERSVVRAAFASGVVSAESAAEMQSAANPTKAIAELQGRIPKMLDLVKDLLLSTKNINRLSGLEAIGDESGGGDENGDDEARVELEMDLMMAIGVDPSAQLAELAQELSTYINGIQAECTFVQDVLGGDLLFRTCDQIRDSVIAILSSSRELLIGDSPSAFKEQQELQRSLPPLLKSLVTHFQHSLTLLIEQIRLEALSTQIRDAMDMVPAADLPVTARARRRAETARHSVVMKFDLVESADDLAERLATFSDILRSNSKVQLLNGVKAVGSSLKAFGDRMDEVGIELSSELGSAANDSDDQEQYRTAVSQVRASAVTFVVRAKDVVVGQFRDLQASAALMRQVRSTAEAVLQLLTLSNGFLAAKRLRETEMRNRASERRRPPPPKPTSEPLPVRIASPPTRAAPGVVTGVPKRGPSAKAVCPPGMVPAILVAPRLGRRSASVSSRVGDPVPKLGSPGIRRTPPRPKRSPAPVPVPPGKAREDITDPSPSVRWTRADFEALEAQSFVEEPADAEHVLIEVDEVTKTETVKCATLISLIQRLTSSSDFPDQISYQKTFVTTYRSFTTPRELFVKLRQRYNVVIPKLPSGVSLDEFNRQYVTPVQLRTVNILKMWVETSYPDIAPDRLLIDRLNIFLTERLPADGREPYSRAIQNAMQKCARRLSLSDQHGPGPSNLPRERPRGSVTRRIHSQLMSPDDSSDFVLLSPIEILRRFSEDAIARQLALIDSAVFRSIQPVELLNQNWSKDATKAKAPNVCLMIDRFNCLSGWATSLLLWQPRVEDRTAVYEKLVRIAEQLRLFGCFNGCLAIVSGLNHQSVYRLKHTKEGASKSISDTYSRHMALLDSAQSYKTYRAALKQINPPCVPYLGVYLTDLTFINDGNKDELGGLINFRKRRLVSAVLQEVQLYQNETYSRFVPQDQLLELLYLPPRLTDEDYMFDLSLRLEPRGKERSEIQ